ncbi:MAG: helix-turn-helix transcriptional regulator [Phaeospirillum sp.]|nr:helix-turn-helix transcriptional regulator [Phaeospirillum sp.]
MTFLARHIKAARLWLDWDQKTLAVKSGVSLPTIQRMEASDGQVRGHYDTVQSVRRTLENAGIEFMVGDAPGVRLHPVVAELAIVADPAATDAVRRITAAPPEQDRTT